MPAAKKNQYAKGHDGSNAGRPSEYGKNGERARAKLLMKYWFEDGVKIKTIDKILKRLSVKGNPGRKGKVKLFELFIARSVASKKGISLQKMFDKLFPDQHKYLGDSDSPLFPPVEIILPKKKNKK